jgi:hypothetical protein
LGFTSLEDCCDPLYLWVITSQEDGSIARPNEEKVVENMLVKYMQALVHVVNKVELLLMITVALLVVLCVLLFVIISKSS